jgi:peptidoglycan/LPS O-acetylase OafA/YrhL
MVNMVRQGPLLTPAPIRNHGCTARDDPSFPPVAPLRNKKQTEQAQNKHKLPSLTGLRWVAAFFVFGLHASDSVLTDGFQQWVLPVFAHGFVGVSCFFVLSGFVLAWSARERDTLRRFWLRRFAKIYPLHLVTLLGALWLLQEWRPWPGWRVLVSNLLLVQAWPSDWQLYTGVNPVNWSLSCEAFFYALFPLLFWGLRRMDPARLPAVALLFGAAIWWVPALALGDWLNPGDHWRFLYILPLPRALEFALGVTIALMVKAGSWRGVGVPAALAIVTGTYVLGTTLPRDLVSSAAMATSFALLIPALAQADLEGAWSPLRSRALVFLGEVSYSFYLVHIVVIIGAIKWFQWEHLSLAASFAATGGVFGVSFVVAWVLYRTVEIPAMRFLTGRSRPPRQRSRRGGIRSLTRLRTHHAPVSRLSRQFVKR